MIVVGGGAAGILAAWNAARNGAEVTLLEKTERLGTKILISGGGKCNITHDGPLEDLLKEFRPNEARFVRPSCYRFTNHQVVEMLTEKGLRVMTRPDGRIFPVDQTAKDVVAILASYLRDSGVKISLKNPVASVAKSADGWTVSTPQGQLSAEALVVTVGGSSYPKTGTTGDGWAWARSLGHKIVPVRAALAPIDLQDPSRFPSGVALRDCVLRARSAPKEVARWRGDLLFTHHGVSGPTALGVSREVAEARLKGAVRLEVDLVPDTPFEELQRQLHLWAKSNPQKTAKSIPFATIAESLAPLVLESARIGAETKVQSLAKRDLNVLCETVKRWDLGAVSRVPLEKGEVVAGGIDLNEVDPRTMESKLSPSLYFAGEILDIAGPVGGYNLQAAFATGYVAGESASQIR